MSDAPAPDESTEVVEGDKVEGDKVVQPPAEPPAETDD